MVCISVLPREGRNFYLMNVHSARQDAWFFCCVLLFIKKILKQALVTTEGFEWRIFIESSYSVGLVGHMRRINALLFSIIAVLKPFSSCNMS